MSRQVPGTRALRTLVAAGRQLNFTRAADELGLTPAAVSHQIKEIEDQLGVALFIRTSRTIRLTDAGVVMLEAATEALDVLQRAAGRIKRLDRADTSLKVTMEPTFAAKWLIPRMANFRQLHPDIELRIDISESVRDFELDDIDAGIRWGKGNYPGLHSEKLFENLVVPVCSPVLMSGPHPLREPRDLLHHTLCQVDWTLDGLTWPNWRMWMEAAGIRDFDDSRCIVFDDTAFAIHAAITGTAVALAEREMVAGDLASGRLVQPFELGLTAPFDYFLIHPIGDEKNPSVTKFREWMLAEVRREDDDLLQRNSDTRLQALMNNSR